MAGAELAGMVIECGPKSGLMLAGMVLPGMELAEMEQVGMGWRLSNAK